MSLSLPGGDRPLSVSTLVFVVHNVSRQELLDRTGPISAMLGKTS
jgi:hypothetical protein